MSTNMSKVVEYRDLINPDDLASQIGTMWVTWDGSRAGWLREKQELRNYLFATDTSTTSNATLPWKNTTTRPKLTQIRDNLHANYMAALFPHTDFFSWVAGDKDATNKAKADLVLAYMRNKIEQSGFMDTMSKLVYDYIDYGNAFAEVVYVSETVLNEEEPDITVAYIGPRLVRISPLDVVMNPKAHSFHHTPHISRSIMSLGELAKMREDVRGSELWIDEAFDKALDHRRNAGNTALNYADSLRKAALTVDGFGDMFEYYSSGQVEVLEFNGDIYDLAAGKLYPRHRIIVIDRAHVVYRAPFTSWLGRCNREHVGWRQRPDNLWAMGPLDNLVGMQYRMDHLENLKADVFDQIAHPVVYQRGEVEEWTWGPGQKIMGDVDSEVRVLSPDTTALNADFQMNELERVMEDMAGAPRQSMGIRTPGEKTAFEVQTLENNTGRIFHHKTSYFDSNFVEPVLNQMLAASRQSMDAADLVRIEDADFGAIDFLQITKDDLQAKGKLIARGAKHFARRAQVLQNLTGILNSAVAQDPAVNVHWSGLKLAEAIFELADLDEWDIVSENIRVSEQLETQKMMQVAEQEAATVGSMDETGATALQESGAMDQLEDIEDEEAMPDEI